MTRAALRAQIPMNGKLPKARPAKHVRRDERRTQLPPWLVHGLLPEPVAELRRLSDAVPSANLLSLVVELQVVDDSFRVQSQQGTDDRRVVIGNESVPARARDPGERRERLRIDWPRVIRQSG